MLCRCIVYSFVAVEAIMRTNLDLWGGGSDLEEENPSVPFPPTPPCIKPWTTQHTATHSMYSLLQAFLYATQKTLMGCVIAEEVCEVY